MSDNYMEIYKKYRPNRWEDVIGQDKTVKSLKVSLLKDSLPTGYGFFGKRGTGKTTLALLLAKAVNCEKMSSTGNPCNECSSCVSIDFNNNPDVVYESMANNGGVEDVRKMVEKANFAPLYKKRVFIFDEVHNLSKAAFESLLIPLESPTTKALFILCSTDPQKIPETIFSRIKKRNLMLVSNETMRKKVEEILEKEGESLSDDQIDSIVRQGKGSVRDTLNILESELIDVNDDDDDEEEVDFYSLLIHSVSEHDISKTYRTIAEATAAGVSGDDLAEQLFSDVRDLMIIASGGDRELTPNLPEADYTAVIKGMMGLGGLNMVAQSIGEAISKMGMNVDSRIMLEVALGNSIRKLKAAKAKRG